MEFTQELFGPAHDAKWACVYHQTPSEGVAVWIIVFGTIGGALTLAALYSVAKKWKQNTDTENGSTKAIVPTADDVKSMADQQATNSGNPHLEL
jgi:hypothetical protein